MKKLIITETGKMSHQSTDMKFGWLIGVLSGVIKYNDDLPQDAVKFLCRELMAVLDPIKDKTLIESIKFRLDERGYEVKEKVTEPNLLHE